MAKVIDINRQVSAKEVRMLQLLQQEYICALYKYDRRSWDKDAHQLKLEKVLARKRYRVFWDMITSNH